MTGSEEHDEQLRKAVLYAAGLCARGEQCEHDLRQKLLRRELSDADVELIIGYLRKHRYVDDSRYSAAYVRTKSRLNGWGPWKIRQGLATKGISKEIIAGAMQEADEADYIKSAYKAACSKARKLDLTAIADRQKLYRFLMSKGFGTDIISAILKRLSMPEEEEEIGDTW